MKRICERPYLKERCASLLVFVNGSGPRCGCSMCLRKICVGKIEHEKHKAGKDPKHGHRHKIEEEMAAAVAVGGGGYAFHEHHEKKEAKEEAEKGKGKKHDHLF